LKKKLKKKIEKKSGKKILKKKYSHLKISCSDFIQENVFFYFIWKWDNMKILHELIYNVVSGSAPHWVEITKSPRGSLATRGILRETLAMNQYGGDHYNNKPEHERNYLNIP
jgi:hypothetical protein